MKSSVLHLPAHCAPIGADNLAGIDGGCCHRAAGCCAVSYDCPYQGQPAGRHARRRRHAAWCQPDCTGFDCMVQAE